ncbi:MAG: transposase [Acidobacteriota bacterium]
MQTDCKSSPLRKQLQFEGIERRALVADFNGGEMTSDGGALLLQRLEKRTGVVEGLADCFRDYRNPERVEHSLVELLKQRVFGWALGYEDLNDHDD